MPSVTLHTQDPLDDSSHLYRVVNQHLGSASLRTARVAMAYVSWGGLSLVADALEGFLSRKGRFSSIFGVGNGVTTSDALCYAHYLHTKFRGQTDSYGLSWEYSDSAFHSKMFEFVHEDHVTVLIGSANVTNGGLAANHEMTFAVSAAPLDTMWEGTEKAWQGYLKLSQRVDPTFIQGLAKQRVLGSEGKPKERSGDSVDLRLPRAEKPLFAHILEGDTTAKQKHDTFSGTSTLSEKPSRLYLEILGETGGGHQVQLPVATLATFFGVGEGESRDVSFQFSGGEDVNVQLTHFSNNTHRVRLLPIRAIPRPSILVFERSGGDDEYTVRVVSQGQYQRVITQRCTEQTRAGSRRWGFE